MKQQMDTQTNRRFNAGERQALYEIMFHRRDIRQFRDEAVPDAVLQRILAAAHAAPSVGYMQPWNFILIQDLTIKQTIHTHFQEQNQLAARHYAGQKRRLYDSFKLEGIMESPVNLAVTSDPDRGGPHVLGRNSMPETGSFSVCCAVQNLWLAARAENVGVGWVSILQPEEVKRILHIPRRIQLIAYLCIGYPITFPASPELEQKGWRSKLKLDEICFYDGWNCTRPKQKLD